MEIIADMIDSYGGYDKSQKIELTSRSSVQLVLAKWEKALVKEIIADMMDSHGGYEKSQVTS